MHANKILRRSLFAAVMAAAFSVGSCAHQAVPPASTLTGLEKIAQVDARFQSYNIEMVEITGGRFWAPYGGPAGEVYRMRPPEDLSEARLRALAKHLGPAYVRVSGTWANSTYLLAEGEQLKEAPAGFNQILTRDQWRGVLDFAKAADARIGVSFAVSPGARDADGVWRSDQAQRLLDLTREAGGDLAFSEFINEPNAAALGNLPKGYSAENYARDFRLFRTWAKHAAPNMIIAGPGSVGEGALFGAVPVAASSGFLHSKDLMQANPNSLDAVSYHFYGNVSQRCAAMLPSTADKSAALSPNWLDQTLQDLNFYSRLRDQYEPAAPMWLTETAQAACGGSPWAASFLDTFRYLNQLGLLAQKGVQVVMHNTLAASDYALIDGEARQPRPNYWAAVLWRRTMATTVLAPPPAPSADVRLYAHCLRGAPGGVALLAINLGDKTQPVATGAAGSAWVVTADHLESVNVTVNGRSPRLEDSGALSGLDAADFRDSVAVPGKAIAFIAAPSARNAACR
jgi:heparanase 1